MPIKVKHYISGCSIQTFIPYNNLETAEKVHTGQNRTDLVYYFSVYAVCNLQHEVVQFLPILFICFVKTLIITLFISFLV